MATRQEKVNSLLQREIASFILSEDLPGSEGLTTITKVDTTADLEDALVYFSTVGQDPIEVLKILERHIYKIQGMLNRKLEMRKVPRIKFVHDDSGAYAQKISELIKNLHADDDPSQGKSPDRFPGS